MRTPVHLGILENCEGNVLAGADGHDGYGCLLACPIVNFQAVSSTGFGLATPSELFKIAQAVAGDCVSVFQYLLYAVYVGKPMGFNGRVVFQSGQKDRHTDICGNIFLGCMFRYVEFAAADSATVIHLRRNHAQQINICGASACRRRRAKESLSNLSGYCRYQKSVYGFGRLLRYSSFVVPAMAGAARLNKTTAAKMAISFFITNAPL